MKAVFNPRLIALCGAPEVGKSTVQKALASLYGVRICDDGRLLRDAAMALYGFTEDMVTTQAGKAMIVDVCGRKDTVRTFMGELGCAIEAMHGTSFFPYQTLEGLKREYGPALETAPRLSFGSVRRDQPWFFREQGALVIEIVGPGSDRPVGPYDRYDASAAHLTIYNPRNGADELTSILRDRLGEYFPDERLPDRRKDCILGAA